MDTAAALDKRKYGFLASAKVNIPLMPSWSTACHDWENRIVAGESLIPFPPLFPDEAAAALDIFRDLRMVDVANSPTMGEVGRQWIFDLVAAVFGAYDANSGRRLIRNFLVSVAKKNGKSTLAAGIMVTALCRNWRNSGEFYILAPTKEIADNSFSPARDMIRADPNLAKILHPNQNTRTIKHRNTGAFLKVVAADSETVSGKKTIGLLVDELWLLGKRAGAEAMLREATGGLASRPEGFVIYLTTQSDRAPEGVFAQKLEHFRDVRDGKVHDPLSLPLLYEFPRAMIDARAYEDPANWRITNPNFGASVDPEFLSAQFTEAKRSGQASLNGFFAKYLNVQIGMALRADGWAGAAIWSRGIEPGLSLDEILRHSEVVTIGLDGGGLDDLLGIGLIGRERGTGRWLGWAHGLVSTIGIRRRPANAEKYLEFKRAGDLTVFEFSNFDAGASVEGLDDILGDAIRPDPTPGAWPPDIAFVVDLVKRAQGAGLLAQVGVDAAGIGSIVDALAGIGVTQEAETLDAVRQGIGLMNAVKTIERKLADGSFRHGGGSMLAWCVGNLVVMPTRTAMMVARDEAGYGKIDPFMALANAAHLMSLNPDSRGASVYNEIGAAMATKEPVPAPRRSERDPNDERFWHGAF